MIQTQSLSVAQGDHDLEARALDGVTLTLARAKLVCLIGPNGAGKTTLLKAIAGLLPHSGTISIEGRDASTLSARERARLVAYLPQGHVAHWPITAREVVAIGRVPHGAGSGRLRSADEAAIERALAATGTAHLAERPINELSGGERGRIMLARALAVEAPILLADEPTAALDPAHQLTVMALLARLAGEGRTVLAAIHDLTLAARFADVCLALDRGRIAAAGAPSEVLTPALFAKVFGISALHLTHDGTPVVVPWLTQAELRR